MGLSGIVEGKIRSLAEEIKVLKIQAFENIIIVNVKSLRTGTG